MVINYKMFGDAVTFNITYNINKYKLIFEMFWDMNYHLNSILFDVNFISSKVKESFVWLYEEFLKCIGKTLMTIIID